MDLALLTQKSQGVYKVSNNHFQDRPQKLLMKLSQVLRMMLYRYQVRDMTQAALFRLNKTQLIPKVQNHPE